MRIVIVGAGKMGYSLAEYLTKEQHEVVVIESNEKHREIIKNSLDILTIEGNGANPHILTDPDVKNADILIACTYSDEVNMIVCMMAKKIGIKKTVARIRNSDYAGDANDLIHNMTEIDLILNPEKIIATEINRILLAPFALDVEDFVDGKIRMFESKVTEESPYINIPLHSLTLPKGILVTGIMRKNKLIIPRGNDFLLPNDNVFFIGLTEVVNEFEKTIGIKETNVERILIIGAGRITQYLAPILEQQGLSVKVIEKNFERSEHIATLLEKGMAICGDGTNIDLLKQEGVAEADVVICLTEDDKLNLLLALLAKHLGANKTVVKTSLTQYVNLMEEVGADIVVSTRLLSVEEVLRFVRTGGIVRVSLFEGAKAEAIEVIVQENNPLAGIPLRNSKLSQDILVCAVEHNGKAIIPDGNTVIYPGDRIIMFIEFGAANDIISYFEER